nr:hypothetical protein [Tanacetum cinerariifolium]
LVGINDPGKLWCYSGFIESDQKDHIKYNGKGKEVEHHYLKVNKDDKGQEKLVEDNGKGKVHDIQNRVESVKVDLARAIKAKQQAKKAREADLKAKEAKKAKEEELKANKTKEEKEAMVVDIGIFILMFKNI